MYRKPAKGKGWRAEGGGVRCACGLPRPLILPIVGIQYLDAEPRLILWDCSCGSTRAIKWPEATRAQRVEAFLADMARRSRCEMAVHDE